MTDLEKINGWLQKFGEKVERNGRLLETTFEVLEEIRGEMRIFRNTLVRLDERIEALEKKGGIVERELPTYNARAAKKIANIINQP